MFPRVVSYFACRTFGCIIEPGLEAERMQGLIPEIERRTSKRALSPEPIGEQTIERLVAAATSAASCYNNQPWRFIFVDAEPVLSLVKRHLSGGNYWAERAPLIVLAVTDAEWDCRLDEDRDYALFDTGMATGYLILQAVRDGLVAHPIAGFKAPELKVELGIAPEHILIACVVIGWPGDQASLTERHRKSETAPRSRKPVNEVAFRNEWPAAHIEEPE
jgi:nitroreductase